MDEKYLIFYSDEHRFCLRFEDVKIIIAAVQPTPIPDFPDYVMGTVTHYGEAVPVINLRTRFNYTPKKLSDRDCIIITDGEKKVGLLCDRIEGFIEVSDSAVMPPPDLSEEASARFLKGEFLAADKSPCYILSPELIIKPEDEKAVLSNGSDTDSN